jgi:fructokinase
MGILVGSIEAGGTKFVCAVGNENLEIVDKVSFPTVEPSQTLEKVCEYFKRFDIKAIGIGSFGPIDINEKSETYGYVTSTPKPGWANFDF